MSVTARPPTAEHAARLLRGPVPPSGYYHLTEDEAKALLAELAAAQAEREEMFQQVKRRYAELSMCEHALAAAREALTRQAMSNQEVVQILDACDGELSHMLHRRSWATSAEEVARLLVPLRRKAANLRTDDVALARAAVGGGGQGTPAE